MAAGIYDIYIEQGSTYTLDITYTEDGETPVSLVGFLGRGQIKAKATDALPLATFTVTISDPANGVVTAVVPASESEAIVLTGKTYKETLQAVYDIEVYNLDGIVIRLLNGPAYISPEVTK